VLNCEVGSGPDPPNGAASFTPTHTALEHIVFTVQSLSVEHVFEAAAGEPTGLDWMLVSTALGVGVFVSKTIKEKSEAKLVGSGVGEESAVERADAVVDCRNVLNVEGCLRDAVEVVVWSRRLVVTIVVDIMIKRAC